METIDHKIRRLMRYYERMTGSRNPIKIAEYANIRIAILPLGNIAGNYKLINRKRWIFINDSIPADSPLFEVVAAHELGHALLHRKENCAFIKTKLCCSHLASNRKQTNLLLISSYRMICCRLIPGTRRASSVIVRDIQWN